MTVRLSLGISLKSITLAPNLNTAFEITIRILAFGLLLSSLELLKIKKQFNHSGVFSISTVLPFHNNIKLLQKLDSFLKAILLIQIFASLVLVILGPISLIGRIMLISCLLTMIIVRWRRHRGSDGAEQMMIIVFAAAVFAILPHPSQTRLLMVVMFIAGQLTLSYFTSGIAKLISPSWRRGEALPAILATYNHGSPKVSTLLYKYRSLAFTASWSVIGFECLFPILIFSSYKLMQYTLLVGFIFHLMCAFFMGLNSFIWSFPSLYPCVIALFTIIRN